MPGSTQKELIVGVVFLAILVMIGAFTIVIRGIPLGKPPEDLLVYFKDGVGGLREGNVVRISGLEVGQVEKMRLQARGVLAQLRIRNGIKLHPGYTITVRAFSPLGGKYVDIERGDERRGDLDYDAFAGRTIWDEAFEFAPEVAFHEQTGPSQGLPLRGDVEADLLAALSDTVESIKPDIEATVRNIRETTEKINTEVGTLGKFVGDPSLFEALRKSAENFEAASASLASVLAKADSDAGTIGKLFGDPSLYDNANRALAAAGNIAEKVDQGKGVAGELVNDGPMVADLRRATASLANALAALEASEQHPQGKGTAGRLLHDPAVFDELNRSLAQLDRLLTDINTKNGPVGVLVRDEAAGRAIGRTLASVEKSAANVEKVTAAVADGRGTIGQLVMDDQLVKEAQRVLVQIRESVEDTREQAPINAFVSAVFQAF